MARVPLRLLAAAACAGAAAAAKGCRCNGFACLNCDVSGEECGRNCSISEANGAASSWCWVDADSGCSDMVTSYCTGAHGNCNSFGCGISYLACSGPAPAPPSPPAPPVPPTPGGGVEVALNYALQVVGTPYGWWTGGGIPEGAPAWTGPAPYGSAPPAAATVREQTIFCAGIPNLMLRKVGKEVPCEQGKPDPVGGEFCGGTGAYGRNYSSVATKFDLNAPYKRGTLFGVKYESVSEQGHVAVLVGDGKGAKLFQSYDAGGGSPGANTKYTLEEAHDALSFCRFQYAVAPEHWLL